MANSRKRRPMMPPISSSGMKTAISETLMEKTVKPISFAPSSVACIGVMPCFQMAGDVLHHHDGIVHHEAAGDGQRHQRKVVEGKAAEIHHREGPDQGDGNRNGRDQSCVDVAQEKEDDQNHQHHRDDEGALDIGDRSADGQGAVENGDQVLAAREWWPAAMESQPSPRPRW